MGLRHYGMLSRLWYRWSQDDRRSWVAHASIALVLSWVFSPAAAVGYYTFRECEQVFMDRFVYHNPVMAKWVDHVMDVVTPAAAVGLWTALFG